MNSTTQENSSTAEELSTSSSELQGQAGSLKQLLTNFNLDEEEDGTLIEELKGILEKHLAKNNLKQHDKNIAKQIKQNLEDKTENTGVNIEMNDEDDKEYEKY